MTTIAYKDGIIAYDSRTTRDGIIVDHNSEKMTQVDGVHFFLAGSKSDFPFLINLYFGKDIGKKELKDIDARAIVFDDGRLFDCAVCPEQGFWKSPIRKDQSYAIGSGEQFAFAAMDLGKSAAEAVACAAHRDTHTGGEIKIFMLDQMGRHDFKFMET